MAKDIICLLVMQTCIYKVLPIYAQPTIQQYIHLTGTPHSSHTITVPASQPSAPPPNMPPTNQPKPATGLPSFSALALPDLVLRFQQQPATQQTTAPPNHGANQPRPATELPSFSTLALPDLVSRLQQLPAIQQTTAPNNGANQPRPPTGIPSFSVQGLPNLVSGLQQLSTQRPADVKLANPSCIDSKLLNNLAVALQLLIVSNILNAPPPVDYPIEKKNEIPTCAEPNSSPYYSQAQVDMPNSNFVGSSGFSEPNIAQVYKPTRNSMYLMSPYEALGTSSSYSDPILTRYGSVNPRQDFQSPYSMMANNDLFSVNDLF